MMKRLMWAAPLAAVASMAAGQGKAADIPYAQPRVFPESVTVTKGGDLITGSLATGTIWRVRKGEAQASAWIDPAQSGLRSTLGVYADDAAHLLWVCSTGGFGDAPDERLSAVRTFDLRTGKALATYPMPNGSKDLCNDFAIARDGSAYIAETLHGAVYRVKPGTAAIESWLVDPKLRGADGIAFDDDGKLYVTSVMTGRAFRIAIGGDGKPGDVTELTPSRKLDRPDGLRALGKGRFLVAEAGTAGGITVMTVKGDTLDVQTPLAGSPQGVTSAVALKGIAYGVVSQRRYLADPTLKAQDPGAFVIYSVPIK